MKGFDKMARKEKATREEILKNQEIIINQKIRLIHPGSATQIVFQKNVVQYI